jgi:hypothetical protein
MARPCSHHYVTGYRKGQPCPYEASAIVALSYSDAPFYVCGYHARAYGPTVVYPMFWSLATVRRFQNANLDALLGGTDGR